jgi:hypothetical protein
MWVTPTSTARVLDSEVNGSSPGKNAKFLRDGTSSQKADKIIYT